MEEKQDQQIVINQPAGHLEENEGLCDAIIREVKEETAWRLTPESIIGIYRWINKGANITYLRTCFTGSVDNHDPHYRLDDGILGAYWLTYEELLRKPLRSPLVKQCIDDYLSGTRYPLSIIREIP